MQAATKLREVKKQGLDLDEGMVLKYHDYYHHGADALHMMALLGSGQGWFNRMNAWLFRFEAPARWLCPAMRGTRNLLLRLKGVHPINNLERM